MVLLVDGSKLCEILSKSLMNWLSILVTPPMQSVDPSLLVINVLLLFSLFIVVVSQ